MTSHNDNLQTLLDLQQNELDALDAVANGIDSRNFAILGANITLLIYIGQAGFEFDLWQAVLVMAPFLASAICNLRLIWPAQYYGNTDVSVHPEYLSMDRNELLLQLISNTQFALDSNSRLNRTRIRACMVALWLAVIGVIILFGTMVIWAK